MCMALFFYQNYFTVFQLMFFVFVFQCVNCYACDFTITKKIYCSVGGYGQKMERPNSQNLLKYSKIILIKIYCHR